MSLTPEDIKDLRRKLSEATPGLWIDMGDTEPWPGTVIATTVPDGGVTPVCIDPEADDRPADRACIAALHNAAPALLDAADALATVTRERDEARQYTPAAQSCHRLADYMSTNRDLLEYDGCDMAGDGAIDVLGRLARERDELRAALLNERGEGEPPSEGWAAVADNGFNLSWQKSGGPRGMIMVHRTVPAGWRYDFTFEPGPRNQTGGARACMLAADVALAAGGKA